MPEFPLYITEGQITNRSTVRNAFNALPSGRYIVKIERRKKRTANQNQYYWGVVVPMVKDGLINAGFDTVRTMDDAHQVLKSLFLKRHFVNPSTGEGIEWIDSTANLQTIQFNSFLEQIWQWASEYLSISIPMPNEQLSFFLAEADHDTNAMIISKV